MPPVGINPLATLAGKGWVSLNQFARIANVSYPTALRMQKDGRVRTIRVGGIHRVYAEEVERFLKEGNFKGEGSKDSSPPSS